MAESKKIKKFYIDSNAVVHKRELLSNILENGIVINIRMVINNGNVTREIKSGQNYVGDIVSADYGIGISFQNIPNNKNLCLISTVHGGSEGVVTNSGTYIDFIYNRGTSNRSCEIGLKVNPASGHTPLANISRGTIELTFMAL